MRRAHCRSSDVHFPCRIAPLSRRSPRPWLDTRSAAPFGRILRLHPAAGSTAGPGVTLHGNASQHRVATALLQSRNYSGESDLVKRKRSRHLSGTLEMTGNACRFDRWAHDTQGRAAGRFSWIRRKSRGWMRRWPEDQVPVAGSDPSRRLEVFDAQLEYLPPVPGVAFWDKGQIDSRGVWPVEKFRVGTEVEPDRLHDLTPGGACRTFIFRWFRPTRRADRITWSSRTASTGSGFPRPCGPRRDRASARSRSRSSRATSASISRTGVRASSVRSAAARARSRSRNASMRSGCK